jgi:hypothetical protein
MTDERDDSLSHATPEHSASDGSCARTLIGGLLASCIGFCQWPCVLPAGPSWSCKLSIAGTALGLDPAQRSEAVP